MGDSYVWRYAIRINGTTADCGDGPSGNAKTSLVRSTSGLFHLSFYGAGIVMYLVP